MARALRSAQHHHCPRGAARCAQGVGGPHRRAAARTTRIAVDVTTEIEIARPRAEVAAYAADPENATTWYENIKAVERRSARSVTFTAEFLGRRLTYTYELVEDVPGERLVMRTAEGPFPMETTDTWIDVDGGTRMALRNRGQPKGFSRLAAPVLAAAMRRATQRDLERLKTILEH
jgi:uncharacterized membrane protein